MEYCAVPAARTAVGLLFNIVCSVGIIFINKRLVFMAANFPFGTTLTIVHFLVTALGCFLFSRLNYFEVKKVELRRVVSICFAFCGYVAFNNMSLLTNSVGVYQVSKIAGTPVIILIEYFAYGTTAPSATLLSLLPVCFGIYLTVSSDADLNFVGAFWATLAVLANSFYTIWGKTKQQELGVTPMQLLSYQAPISAAMLLLTLPLFDSLPELAAWEPSPSSVFYILLSCVFAFGVNFSFFLSVGRTSPLTMNVVGYFKTCLVFVGGFIFFDTPLTEHSAAGIAVTMVGVALYTRSTLTAAKSTAAPAVTPEKASPV